MLRIPYRCTRRSGAKGHRWVDILLTRAEYNHSRYFIRFFGFPKLLVTTIVQNISLKN